MHLHFRPKQNSPRGLNREYLGANDFCRETMESYPNIIVVAKNVGVTLRHPAERPNYYQRFFLTIFQANREHFFDITHMVNGSFIQDNKVRDTLGANT